MTVSRACGSGSNGRRFESRFLPLFGRSLGTCATCERIEKKENSEASYITFACASVSSPAVIHKSEKKFGLHKSENNLAKSK